MNRSDQPAERPNDDDVLDPAQFDTDTSDVGGPDSALGTGVESALTGGAEAESGDEGRASTQPQPTGD